MRKNNQHAVLETTFRVGVSFVGMGNKPGKPKNKPLPLRLREARKRLDMSQERLGELTEMTGVTIGRIEKGQQNWTQDFLQQAARALNVHWIELLPAEPNSLLDLWRNLSYEEQDNFLTQIHAVAAKRVRAA
ncbi:helix-turn-helix domain-containing protein [Caulobacter sp. UC70_42]|uniref:helix-turn-helix domain-containing protein n=1 Tax=Caulobacter sp. UC70_42 TaxID=3374551 RepID=UPI0037573C74